MANISLPCHVTGENLLPYGIERRVGSGEENFFWSDAWIGGVPLSVRYRRLFYLSLNRLSTVVVMSDLGWGAGGAACVWRLQLWVWEEEMLEECRTLLSDILLQPNVVDRWLWRPDPGGGNSVWGAYDLLTSTDDQVVRATPHLIWHKQLPLKVSVVA
ncbi:hypothetical protein TSUD_282260 [Trifolium subterraneum]|uniref:Reverse transcriptase zinc-binding domain-containing protein n=1 Tax=Trifolium subterraneum TaxID=3900 RepID=A0A2Z6MV74_TRISU|nr:hypothetical protein TSUD_282260 [Trifolium subterraneum]